MALSSGDSSQVPMAAAPPRASPRRRPQTARPTTQPFARGATRGTLGNSNRRAVAEMCGPVGVHTAEPVTPPRTSRDVTVANAGPRSAQIVRPQPPTRTTTLNGYKDSAQSRPVIRRRTIAGSHSVQQKGALSKPSSTAGKDAAALTVLPPRHSRRPAPASPRSPARPEAPAPTKEARASESVDCDVSAKVPQPEPQPPSQIRTLSAPHRQERPATPAFTTPRFLHSAMDAATAAKVCRTFISQSFPFTKLIGPRVGQAAARRQGLAAHSRPSFRRPHSAPAGQRKMVAAANGETREVAVAGHLSSSKLDPRWTSADAVPVSLAPPHVAHRGQHLVDCAYGDDRFSGIGISDQAGMISKLRDRMRSNRLAPALYDCDPEQTGTIDAESFHTCMQQLEVRLTWSQVQWIFSAVRCCSFDVFVVLSGALAAAANLKCSFMLCCVSMRLLQLGAHCSHSDGRMDYGKFCEKLRAEPRVGMAKNAHETHAHSDKWIFRREELDPGRPVANSERKVLTVMPRTDPRYEGGDVVMIEQPEPCVHFSGANAPWSQTHTVMGSFLAPDAGAAAVEKTVEATRAFWARGKEGWVDQAGVERKAATERRRRVLRENCARETALTSGRQQATANASAQRIAKRTLKQGFRRDIYEAQARAANVGNLFHKYEGTR